MTGFCFLDRINRIYKFFLDRITILYYGNLLFLLILLILSHNIMLFLSKKAEENVFPRLIIIRILCLIQRKLQS
ncbi:MAG: hypothetical protein CW336_00760 [Bacteroidetes bacterium]|nr:hypothetical protein [Bacteroidota bacterium]